MSVEYKDIDGMIYQTCRDDCGFTTIYILNEFRQVVSELHVPDSHVDEFIQNELREVDING